MKKILTVVSVLGALVLSPLTLQAAPGYDQSRQDLEWVMEYLITWFPGVWDSTPQVWFERNIRMPEDEGEHEHWHRTFARIDAPQIGDVVFYGQINVGGRDGPIIGGSQVLYHAVIDDELGAVNIFVAVVRYSQIVNNNVFWTIINQRLSSSDHGQHTVVIVKSTSCAFHSAVIQ